MSLCVVEPGVRFPDDSMDDIQKQKQLLKDAAAFLVSCQIPSLVSDAATFSDPLSLRGVIAGCVSELKIEYVCVFYDRLRTVWTTALCLWTEPH